MPATASRPRSSATPSGCISASRSACAWSRRCWPRAASSSATRPCGSGRSSSARTAPTGSDGGCHAPGTRPHVCCDGVRWSVSPCARSRVAPGRTGPCLMHRRRTMDEVTTFIGLDVHKATVSVGVAEAGRAGEVRFLGEIPNRPVAIARLVQKLAQRHPGQLSFCYEAGPCGYALYRQLRQAGHDCVVAAPSLVPTRPGERVKTDRRDALTLARLHRAGELVAVWVPDPAHEAMRELVRARLDAVAQVRKARQRLQGFLLRQGRV